MGQGVREELEALGVSVRQALQGAREEVAALEDRAVQAVQEAREARAALEVLEAWGRLAPPEQPDLLDPLEEPDPLAV